MLSPFSVPPIPNLHICQILEEKETYLQADTHNLSAPWWHEICQLLLCTTRWEAYPTVGRSRAVGLHRLNQIKKAFRIVPVTIRLKVVRHTTWQRLLHWDRAAYELQHILLHFPIHHQKLMLDGTTTRARHLDLRLLRWIFDRVYKWDRSLEHLQGFKNRCIILGIPSPVKRR